MLEPFADEADNVDRLTDLLHRAYADQAAAGRRFFASYQSADDTRRRVRSDECWIAVVNAGRDRKASVGGQVGEDPRSGYVGTVTVTGPGGFAEGYPAAERDGSFAQLAVDPAWRGIGLGHRLLAWAEDRLTAAGCEAVVIDTSSEAVDLLAWYRRRGYEPVGTWRWSVTNYDSIVLRKPLRARQSVLMTGEAEG
ncbi:GNAT family N-acetyltransferase [Geodermatophilus sp. FMUSA9-8]|uniref:GNAT family N-acetyltransferase n=1 Tax=Geodermatophilus sp. FMUSA9-8 TaxID=3120155 RepID=UPI003008AEDE